MPPPDEQTRATPVPTLARASITSDPLVSADFGRDGTQVRSETPTHGIPSFGLPVVPGYAVTGEIARGGMGVVYLAHDPAFDREVAVKVMHPGQDAARFVVEAKITAQLPHPGVPPVYALGTTLDGRPFLAMKFIQGRTLTDELRASGRGDLPRLLGAFEQICQTVGFAHSKGILHRDLKPQNVMVGAFGEVQVMDWGLAKSGVGGPGTGDSEDETRVTAPRRGSSTIDETRAGQIKGTPAYMAPEQARGERVDVHADVFALGGILATVLTGHAPFVGTTVMDTIRKAAQAEFCECFGKLDACAADGELVAVVKRCLAADAAERFADGQAVAAAVAAYRAGVEDRLRRAERDRAASEAEAREQRKRRKVQLALAGAVILLLCSAGAFAWWRDNMAGEQELADERARSKQQLVEGDRNRTQERLETERGFKEQQARVGVKAGLELATDLRKLYKFKAADNALAQAEKLAESGAPERLAEVKRARAELALVVRLDDIRYRKWFVVGDTADGDFYNTKIAPPAYRQAFAECGLDLTNLDPAGAANTILTSAVKAELVAAVDDWALYEPKQNLRNRLLEVARKADPGPWTNRLRDPTVWADPAAVAKLAADTDPKTTPSATLSVLAELMRRRALNPSAVLTAARAEHPADFELAFALGQWHTVNAKDDRQIGAFEAAAALRPDNPSVWHNLGGARYRRSDPTGALAAYKVAVRLQPNYAYAYYNLGLALGSTGDLDGAFAACQECIRLDSTYAPAHNNLGVVFDRKGDPDRAIASYREAIHHDPNYFKAHFNLGVQLKNKGQLDEAIASYRTCLQINDRYALAHYHLGLALKDKGEPEAAIGCFREAINHDRPFALAHYHLGLALREKGDLNGAIAAYRATVVNDPANAPAYNNLGLALKDKGELVEAIAAYREAIKYSPTYAHAHNNLGVALRSKGELDAAVASYRDAIKHDATFALAHNNLGLALNDQGKTEAAIAAFREAIKQYPMYAHAHNNLGLALANKGKLDAAIDSFRQAIKHAPAYAHAHNNLGLALKGTGELEAAIAAYREAVKHDPTFAQSHFNLAVALKDKGDLNGAIAAYREAIKAYPKYVVAHNNLGVALRSKGELDAAIAAYREALKHDPKYMLAHINLSVALRDKGYALHKKNDTDGSAAAFKEAIEHNPKDAIAHTDLGVIYGFRQNYSQALACARTAIKIDPNYANAHVLLGDILLRTGDTSGARAALTEAARLDKRWALKLALLPPIPVAPAPREVRRP